MRSMAGVGMTPPKVLGAPKPWSSVMMSSTLGAPFGGTTRGAHQAFDSEAFSLRLFAIIEAKLYGAPHQAKMRFRLLCSFRRPYAIRWISLILLLNPSVIPLV